MGFVAFRAITGGRSAPLAPSSLRPDEFEDITRSFVMNVVLPMWLGAGIADWVCRRRARIEDTSGPKESLIHLGMLAEAAIPVLCGMFLEITSPVLALAIAAALLHGATALWDVSYAVTRRKVTPIEQHIHSFLEMVRMAAIAFISVLHWPQLLALLGCSDERSDWRSRWKQRPRPWAYATVMLAAQVGLEWLPYLEELIRTFRAVPKASSRSRVLSYLGTSA